MEAKTKPAGAPTLDGANRPTHVGPLTGSAVGVALGQWQSAELRLARSFAECRGLGREQLEDIYQETALALLERSFQNEGHLRNALRWGIKHRALHHHRDERRRSEILTQRASEIQLAAQQRQHVLSPEDAAVIDGDRIIVSEFLAELDELERRIFWLTAEGLRYRSIAPILGVPVNDARKAARSCEQKRERFQILYDSGRLCGYRAQTITAIQAGQQVTEQLAQRAYTHLHGCASCRAQHNTNARRLRQTFLAHAAALAPLPLLTGRLPCSTRIELRARTLAARLIPHALQTSGGGVLRERAIGLLATGGAGAKLAAGAAAVAVIAGGTIGASGALQHQPTEPHAARTRPRAAAAHSSNGERRSEDAAAIAAAVHAAASARSTRAIAAATSSPHRGRQSEPGGFAYLGVPSHGGGEPRAEEASAASTAAPQRAEQTARQRPQAGEEQHGGGPFSP